MDTSEFYDYEDRSYINPTLSSGEQEKFIDNLRDIQKQNTAQIAEQTYNLGTQVPSNLGGLGGGEAYFTSRYQTPQTNEMVQTLKAAAQAQELQDVMTNYQSQLKNKYSQAQRAYNKRARAKQNAYYNSLLGNNGNNGNNDDSDKLDITTNDKKKGTGNPMMDAFYKALQTLQKNGGKVNTNKNGQVSTGTTQVPAGFMTLIEGGSGSLGLWPNGQKMTNGSTYKYGGKTIVVKYDSVGNRRFEVM